MARTMLMSNLSKDLRKTTNRRSELVKKGDRVKIMRGSHKNKTAKVVEVDYKSRRVFLEGITVTARRSKSAVFTPFDSSNLQIVELSERKTTRKQPVAAKKK